jgi:dTDP-L-rhamnose 4-epimerase
MSQPPTTSRDLAGASVDVVLPALDEALAIDAVLASLPDGYRPIVVDNGSTDDTAARARRNGALVPPPSSRCRPPRSRPRAGRASAR